VGANYAPFAAPHHKKVLPSYRLQRNMRALFIENRPAGARKQAFCLRNQAVMAGSRRAGGSHRLWHGAASRAIKHTGRDAKEIP
jgi:hypothetical protein